MSLPREVRACLACPMKALLFPTHAVSPQRAGTFARPPVVGPPASKKGRSLRRRDCRPYLMPLTPHAARPSPADRSPPPSPECPTTAGSPAPTRAPMGSATRRSRTVETVLCVCVCVVGVHTGRSSQATDGPTEARRLARERGGPSEAPRPCRRVAVLNSHAWPLPCLAEVVWRSTKEAANRRGTRSCCRAV